MRHPRRVWVAGIGSLVVLDVWCDRNSTPGDSLSECVRVFFRPETRLGKFAFVASWAALSGWFLPHILKES